MQGIGLRLLSAFLLTAMSAVVRILADSVPIGQIMFWRSAVAILPICIYLALQGNFPRGLKTKHPGLHVTRSLLGAFSMAMSFLSLAYLPVANAQALAYLAPILVLPMAAFLLGETISRWLVAAILVGFAGVVFLLFEALEFPGHGAWIGVGAGLMFAFTMAFVRVHTKTMTRSENASSIAFYFAVVAAGIGLLTWPFGWVPMGNGLWIWLVLAGLIGGIGHIVSNEAVARAPVSTLAPFDFTGLIWALGFDLILFATFPGTLGMLGVFAITLAAILVTVVSGRKPHAKG